MSELKFNLLATNFRQFFFTSNVAFQYSLSSKLKLGSIHIHIVRSKLPDYQSSIAGFRLITVAALRALLDRDSLMPYILEIVISEKLPNRFESS